MILVMMKGMMMTMMLTPCFETTQYTSKMFDLGTTQTLINGFFWAHGYNEKMVLWGSKYKTNFNKDQGGEKLQN